MYVDLHDKFLMKAPKPSSGKRVKATAKKQISWKSSEEEDDDEENVCKHEDDDDDERTESDNDGDDFVHPKFSTHDNEANQDEEVNEEDSFDPRVEANVLYQDVNVNLEGRDTMMTDATTALIVFQAAQETKIYSVILTTQINLEGQ
ncbi:hypothetical protein Tco_0459845 [Tanacetum coccineum]